MGKQEKQEVKREIDKYEVDPKKVDALVQEALQAYIKPVQQTIMGILQSILVLGS